MENTNEEIFPESQGFAAEATEIHGRIMSYPVRKMTKTEFDDIPFTTAFSEIVPLETLAKRVESAEKYRSSGAVLGEGKKDFTSTQNSAVEKVRLYERGLREGKLFLAEVEGRYYVIENK